MALYSLIVPMCIKNLLTHSLVIHGMICCGCVFRKVYVNPYDRTDSVELVEELKRLNEENNLSLTSRSAVCICGFVVTPLQ